MSYISASFPSFFASRKALLNRPTDRPTINYPPSTSSILCQDSKSLLSRCPTVMADRDETTNLFSSPHRSASLRPSTSEMPSRCGSASCRAPLAHLVSPIALLAQISHIPLPSLMDLPFASLLPFSGFSVLETPPRHPQVGIFNM